MTLAGASLDRRRPGPSSDLATQRGGAACLGGVSSTDGRTDGVSVTASIATETAKIPQSTCRRGYHKEPGQVEDSKVIREFCAVNDNYDSIFSSLFLHVETLTQHWVFDAREYQGGYRVSGRQ